MWFKIFGIIAIITSAFIAGMAYQQEKHYKEYIKQQAYYVHRIQTIQESNYVLFHKTIIQQEKIRTDERERLNVLQKNKELINRTNILTHRFVRYISNTKTDMQADDTESNVSTDKTISAVRFGEWHIGLVAHDNDCVVRYNSLVTMIKNIE